jgi:hypothetical protein
MWNQAECLPMNAEQQEQLEGWIRAPSTPQKVVLRSLICLLAREGKPNAQIARELHTTRPTVLLWRKHFGQYGVAGLEHEPPRRASTRRLDEETVRKIVDTTLQTKPVDATHWSTRTLARHLKLSHMTVARVWDRHGLQPHRVRTFKLSRDKQFVEKLTDVVGLYLNPPDKALVFCVDEKSQIQALDRTQPGLPMKRGRCGTMTHDYVRHGTTTLFAALNVLEGTVIGECFSRHRHEEFLKFLRQVDRQTPAGLDLHLVIDNYVHALHGHAAFAHRGGAAFHRAGAHVARGEDARDGSFPAARAGGPRPFQARAPATAWPVLMKPFSSRSISGGSQLVHGLAPIMEKTAGVCTVRRSCVFVFSNSTASSSFPPIIFRISVCVRISMFSFVSTRRER